MTTEDLNKMQANSKWEVAENAYNESLAKLPISKLSKAWQNNWNEIAMDYLPGTKDWNNRFRLAMMIDMRKDYMREGVDKETARQLVHAWYLIWGNDPRYVKQTNAIHL